MMFSKKKYRLSLFMPMSLLLSLALSSLTAFGQEAATHEPQPLNENELETLQATLAELNGLAPKLRVQMRTLRQQVGFDPRVIHTIERDMGQSQKDLERMIAMHQRNAFNPMRAHFMADDLRRKSDSLKSSLSYVKRRIQELDETQGNRQQNEEVKRNDDALIEQLGLYTDLVTAAVMLLKDKGI